MKIIPSDRPQHLDFTTRPSRTLSDRGHGALLIFATLCDLGRSSAGTQVVVVVRHVSFNESRLILITSFFQMNTRDEFFGR